MGRTYREYAAGRSRLDHVGLARSNDGIFRVPVVGANRGQVLQFVTMPRGAEACGRRW